MIDLGDEQPVVRSGHGPDGGYYGGAAMVPAADGTAAAGRQHIEQLPGFHAGQAEGLHLGAGMAQRQRLAHAVRIHLQKQSFG